MKQTSNQTTDALVDPEYRKRVQGLKDVTAALNGEPSSNVVFSTDAGSVLNRKMLKIKTDLVFADAPEPIGMLWRNLCSLENQLAEKLQGKHGAVVIIDQDAWMLLEQCDELLLYHATYIDERLNDEVSRFDHGLDWVDIEEDQLQDYNHLLQRAVDEFDGRITMSAKLEAQGHERPSLPN